MILTYLIILSMLTSCQNVLIMRKVKFKDYKLTHYRYYLIAQNGDTRNEEKNSIKEWIKKKDKLANKWKNEK